MCDLSVTAVKMATYAVAEPRSYHITLPRVVQPAMRDPIQRLVGKPVWKEYKHLLRLVHLYAFIKQSSPLLALSQPILLVLLKPVSLRHRVTGRRTAEGARGVGRSVCPGAASQRGDLCVVRGRGRVDITPRNAHLERSTQHMLQQRTAASFARGRCGARWSESPSHAGMGRGRPSKKERPHVKWGEGGSGWVGGGLAQDGRDEMFVFRSD